MDKTILSGVSECLIFVLVNFIFDEGCNCEKKVAFTQAAAIFPQGDRVKLLAQGLLDSFSTLPHPISKIYPIPCGGFRSRSSCESFARDQRKLRRKFGKGLFADVRPSISRENGRPRKITKESSTFSTVHQKRFFFPLLQLWGLGGPNTFSSSALKRHLLKRHLTLLGTPRPVFTPMCV